MTNPADERKTDTVPGAGLRVFIERWMPTATPDTMKEAMAAELDALMASRANPCAKILDHKWLDPECVESGCQSLVLPRAHIAALKEHNVALRSASEAAAAVAR